MTEVATPVAPPTAASPAAAVVQPAAVAPAALEPAPAPPGQVPDPVAAAVAERQAPKMTAAQRKQTAAQKASESVAAEKAALLAEKTAFYAERDEQAKHDRLWQEDPLAAIQKKGLTYRQLTDIMLNNGKVTPEMAAESIADKRVEAKLSAWEAEQKAKSDETAKLNADAELDRVNQAIDGFKNQIKAEIADVGKYRLINVYGQGDLIYGTIEENFNRTGKVMAIPEAAVMVETYLANEIKKANPEAAAPAPVTVPPEKKPGYVADKPLFPRKPTLTNAAAPSVASRATKRPTDDERFQRALQYGRTRN